MVRIAGVTLPEKKPIMVALTAIYGIGRSKAMMILKDAGVDPLKRTNALTGEEAARIRERIEKNEVVEGELRRRVVGSIKLLKDLKTYRGMRHAKKLPVRGQRTRTNSRTVRGNVRRTVTSGRRKLEKT
jgi:small subunit ribosomal protein S13